MVDKLSRRGFLAGLAAAGTVHVAPVIGARIGQAVAQRRILTLVYDKAAGGLRAVERLVPR